MSNTVIVNNESVAVVAENTETNVVEVTSAITSLVEVVTAGPAGPPGGRIIIQEEGVSLGEITGKLNFIGPRITVTNDVVNEIATVTVSAAALGANSDITSMSGLTGGISSPDYIQFDTTATAVGAVGQLSWNDTDGTLDLGLKGGNVTLQVGQEQVVRITNTTGITMTDGQAVYVTGSTGNHLNVVLAQANNEAMSSKTLAIVTEPIAHSQSGFGTVLGIVRNLNTSALTEGSAIWLSATTPGGLTTTRPIQPNHSVFIGWCIRQHAVVGSIFVNIQNGYEISELHDVLITNKQNGDVIQYDSTQQVWKNVDGSRIGVTHLSQLDDVVFSTLEAGDVFTYDISLGKWSNERRISLVDGGNF